MSSFKEELWHGALLLLEPHTAKRVEHGFLGAPLDFSKRGRNQSAALLCERYAADALVIVNQVHGDRIVDLPVALSSEPFTDADGIIFPLHTPGRRVIVGVRTADCVPLLLLGATWGVVIHAGWRGIALNIVEKGYRLLQERESADCIGLIGPAAGGERYEVGAEVIGALQPTVEYRNLPSGKALLDPKLTVVRRLEKLGVSAVLASSICTISDPRFHSFRRDKEGMGNNLGFVVTKR